MKKTNQPKFLVMSLKRLVFLMIITLGFYELYWSYKNWKAIKSAEDSDITPVTRAIFSPIFFASLAGKISKSTKGNKKVYLASATQVRFFYYLGLIIACTSAISYELEYVFMGVIGMTLGITAFVKLQSAINRSLPNAKSLNKKTTIREGIVIAIGVMLLILNVWVLLIPEEYYEDLYEKDDSTEQYQLSPEQEIYLEEDESAD